MKLKIFFAVILVIMTVSSNVFAMKLSKTNEIGSISALPPSGAFRIEGAASNQGERSDIKEYKTGREYVKGVACFGSGENALYVHYDNSYYYTEDFVDNLFRSKELANSCRMGAADIKNTVILPLGFPHNCQIYQVENDSNIPMYLLEYDKNAVPIYKLIGKRPDGVWVKYFETLEAEQYYSMKFAFCHNYYIKDNMIVFEYGRYNSKEKKFITNIELQFIWNDSDKWFGLNQVIKDIPKNTVKEVEEENSDDSSENE